MGASCSFIPQVRNKKTGAIQDSKLFKDLAIMTPKRAIAVDLYKRITGNEKFKRDWHPRLRIDDCGEPYLSSLLEHFNLSRYIDEEVLLEKLNRKIGYYKKGANRLALWVDNRKNVRYLTQKAMDFNNNSEFRKDYIAQVIGIQDNETGGVFRGVKVVRRTKEFSLQAKQMEVNEKLNERLRDILLAHGVSIGVLTALEEKRGINGVTDFSQATDAANGLKEIIRLAHGERGERALPEEFAHFILEAVDTPIKERMLNMIREGNLAQEIIGENWERYKEMYGEDSETLVKEAAGQLLAKHLLKQEPIPQKPYKNLLQRFIAAIKEFFRQFSVNEIDRAMLDADREYGEFAKQLLTGEMNDKIKISNISSESHTKLFQVTQERIDKDKALLKKMIEIEEKRLKIFGRRNEEFKERQQTFIGNLKLYQQYHIIDAIYDFCDTALRRMESLQNRLRALQSDKNSSLKDSASTLRDIKRYISSYESILQDMAKRIHEEERESDNRYLARGRVLLDNMTNLIRDLKIDYEASARALTKDMVEQIVGDGIEIKTGKMKGQKITADDILSMAGSKITITERYLDSAADSNNYMIKILDQIVKKAKNKARLDTIELSKKLERAHMEMEKAGITDTKWIYEHDSEGNLTGNFITRHNLGQYRKDARAFMKDLNERYKDEKDPEKLQKKKAEKDAWFDSHNPNREGNDHLYLNPEFDRIMNNRTLKAYYDTVMEMKKALDELLPNVKRHESAPKIRKDLLERVKSQGFGAIKKSLQDSLLRRSDDTEFGEDTEEDTPVTDFEGRPVEYLPIYYTRIGKNEDMNDISTDATSTMIAYAAMANNFAQIYEVLDQLEIARDIIRMDTMENMKRADLDEIEKSKLVNKIQKTFKGQSAYTLARMDDFFSMQVYGKYMKDEGSFGNTKIANAKLANQVNRITAWNTFAFNLISGISNVTTGNVMMNIEAFSKEFCSASDLFKADRTYAQEVGSYMAEIGDRVQTSKLALWDELFNVLQDYEENIAHKDFDRKTWVSRAFKEDSIYFLNNAGEHWMQNRTSLALAFNYKMKDKNGKLTNLWDAMEVVYNDPNDHNLGARLQVKEGYTKEDGTKFTEEDIYYFTRKSAAINEKMHGIYNKEDMPAIQSLAVGRLAMLYRKWMRPSWNRRFRKGTYNFDTQVWEEGYYRTLGRFLKQVYKDLRAGEIALISEYKKLSDEEKHNVWRGVTEVSFWAATWVGIALLALCDADDKDDNPWARKMAELQFRRLATELGSMTPNPLMIQEGFKILQSPAASISPTSDAIKFLIGLVNPWNYETFAGEEALVKSGKHKGESKIEKLFWEAPFLPFHNQVYRATHPEESIPFYKRGY